MRLMNLKSSYLRERFRAEMQMHSYLDILAKKFFLRKEAVSIAEVVVHCVSRNKIDPIIDI